MTPRVRSARALPRVASPCLRAGHPPRALRGPGAASGGAILWLPLLVGLLAAPGAWAQTGLSVTPPGTSEPAAVGGRPVALREVVVTATRDAQPVESSARPVQVIGPAEIERAGVQTLSELLGAQGLADITANGGRGQPAAVRLRGAESRHTLLLVDGLRVDSATAGLAAIEHLPLEQIERIEILRGPASGLYGSDAIGGVVQVFTRGGAGSGGARASVGYGSQATRQVSASLGRDDGRTDVRLALGHSATRGFSATRPTIPFGQYNADADSARNVNASGRLVQRWAPGQELGLSFFAVDATTRFDAGAATDDRNRQSIMAFSAHSRNRITDEWESLLRAGRSSDDIDTVGAFPSAFRTTQDQLTWQNSLRLPVGRLVAGVDHLEQRVSATVPYDVGSRRTLGAFAGLAGEAGAHAWQFNLRHDDNSQFGGQNTGSFAWAWSPAQGVRLRAGAGTAFKAPTFNDLYYRDAFFNGNPALRPERSRSRELGADLAIAGQRVSITAFDNEIRDLIVIDPVSFATVINLQRTRTRGVELGWRGTVGPLRLRAEATLQDPQDADTGRQLPRRARQYGALGATLPMGRWLAAAEVSGADARFDRAGEPPATRMSGFGVVNATLRYALDRSWAIDLRWDNVFDRDYERVQHYAVARSQVFVALRWQAR